MMRINDLIKMDKDNCPSNEEHVSLSIQQTSSNLSNKCNNQHFVVANKRNIRMVAH